MRATILLLLAVSASAWKVFNVPHTDGQDDTPAITTAFAAGRLSANTTILFKKGVTYNIFTPIKFPIFNNVEVRIEGNLTYPKDIPTIQSEHFSIQQTVASKVLTSKTSLVAQ